MPEETHSYTKRHFALKVSLCGVKLYSVMAKGHWGIADIKNDVDAMEVLLQARPSLMGANLQNSLKEKVKMMNLNGPAELAQVYQVVQQSKLPEGLQTELLQALDWKASSTMNEAGLAKLSLNPQQCDGLGSYFTQAELDALQSKDMDHGAHIIASRLKLLGVKSCKENLKKLATALLVWYEHKHRKRPMPSLDSIYSLSVHFLQTFQSCTTSTPEGALSLPCYPDSPHELTKGHYNASYPIHAPVEQTYEGLAEILRYHIKVRNSYKNAVAKVSWLLLKYFSTTETE